MNDGGSLRLSRARLWPQTELLKASMFFASHCDSHDQSKFLDQASLALTTILSYLTEHGVWRDKMFESKTFLDEPAPASSLYHIMASYIQTRDALRCLLERPLLAVELA